MLATGDIHTVPLRVGARPGQRAVEDVLDPRRRPPGRRRDRRGHRGAADARGVRRRDRRPARRSGPLRRRPSGARSTIPRRCPRWAGAAGDVGGRRGVAGGGRRPATSIGRGPPRLGRAEGSSADPPVASRPRGLLIVDEEAARLAKKGKGKKVRFQGGTLFPMVILAIVVFGLATIVYARASAAGADASPPTVRRPLAHRLRLLLCDDRMVKLSGALEEADANGQLVNTDFLRTGVHSHDDGVIHWHAYTSAAVGTTPRSAYSSTTTASNSTRHAEVPGEPGWQGVRRGRDEVPRRQGRRAGRDRLGEPGGHQRRPALRRRTSTTSASTRTAS